MVNMPLALSMSELAAFDAFDAYGMWALFQYVVPPNLHHIKSPQLLAASLEDVLRCQFWIS